MASSIPSPSSLPTVLIRERFSLVVKNCFNSKLKNPTSSSEKHLLPCRASKSPEASEKPNSTGSSARSQLDLLEQLTSSTSPNTGYESDDKPTIREQLSELIGDRNGEFSLPLGKKLMEGMKSLTISQKRNIKRQDYLNEVSRRNDSRFFATIGAFVILPPVVILSVAISTGYVQLFP